MTRPTPSETYLNDSVLPYEIEEMTAILGDVAKYIRKGNSDVVAINLLSTLISQAESYKTKLENPAPAVLGR